MFAECCVFVKQSQPPGHCGCRQLQKQFLHQQQRTFSRSYGTILPSSFTRVLSQAPWYSLPDHQCWFGYVLCNLKLRGFSWKRGISNFMTVESLRLGSRNKSTADLPPYIPTTFHQGLPTAGSLSLLRPPHRSYKKCRNINPLPIDYAFQPRLRGRLTLPRLTLDRNPWSSGEGVFHPFNVTHVSIRTSDISSMRLPHTFTDLQNAPLPPAFSCKSAASVTSLSPVTSSAQADSTSELLRFL